MGAVLDAALEYAKSGYSVIPVKRSDKAPYTQHGLKDASRDPDVITGWWNEWPEANVAIACGRPSGNLFVIDIDIKPEKGKHGDEELLKWQAEHGDFPNTVTQRTGSGGQHQFFRHPDIVLYMNKVDAIPGVDIRGDGAYVVVAPSIYEDGRTYEWEGPSILDTIEVADANESVLDLLKLNPRYKSSEQRKRSAVPYKEMKTIEAGHRQEYLMILQGLLVNAGLTIDAIEAAVRIENETKCDPPMSEEELRKEIFPFLRRNNLNVGSDYTEMIVPATSIVSDDELDIPTLDQIKPERAEWLERGYIPAKSITILCGTGGTGKTSIWCSIAAAISRGERSFLTYDEINTGKFRENKKVMFFSAEDSVSVVLVNKLQQAKAELSNIMCLDVSDERFRNIKLNSPQLDKLLERHRPALCIFDPIQAFIDKKLSMSDRNAMRQEMEPLIRFGQKYGTTFLIIMHTNKQSNVWGRQRMADSSDLWDISRSVLMVGDTGDEELGYISQEKNSYAKKSDTVIFKNTGGVVTWQAFTKKTDKDFVLEASKKRSRDTSDDLQDACNLILSELTDHNGKMLVQELNEEMQALDYSSYMIKKAKQELRKAKKIAFKKDGYEGKNYIYLPSTV